MKIGIYVKHLNSLGGGERVALVMAEILSKAGNDVSLIATYKPEKKILENALGVNLKNVKIESWYERAYEKLANKTKKYDLFINTSYLDHLPSKAKKSIYYVHFPTPIKHTLLGFIKYETLLPFLRRYLVIPEIITGVTPIDEITSRVGKWLDKETSIVISNTPKKFRFKVRLYVEQLTLSVIDLVEFSSPSMKLEMIDREVDHYNNVVTFSFEANSTKGSGAVINFRIKKDIKRSPIALVSLTISNPRYFLWNLIKRFLPRYEMALYGSSSYKPAVGLGTYDRFLVNSEYTKKWTEKYWGKDTVVVYPPVDVEEFKPGNKENIILNVGRFFWGGHTKRQDILVEAFKEMVDKNKLDKTWELHLIGGVASGIENTEFVKKMKESAEGYKIFFHHSVGYKELKSYYAKARIYWHATGYGVSERSNPISMEHFGITPVEAMAAGCVPVVFKGGGLIETVNKGSGYVWKSVNELVNITSMLIKNKKEMKKRRVNSIERAKLFSRKKFGERVIEEINNIK